MPPGAVTYDTRALQPVDGAEELVERTASFNAGLLTTAGGAVPLGDLVLAFEADGGPSRGTARTSVERLGQGGCVRRDGELVQVPLAWKTREIPFAHARRNAVTIPWGDVYTAWVSTGIPDIELNKTSSRNPLIVDQHTIINSFDNYKKFYFLGGSASWANIRGLLTANIPNLEIYEEGSYASPRVDVW